MKIKSQTSAIQIVIAIVVLLIVALAIVALSTNTISDLGQKVKDVIGAVFGSSSEYSGGGISQILNEVTNPNT